MNPPILLQNSSLRLVIRAIVAAAFLLIGSASLLAQTPIDLSRPVGMTAGAAGNNGAGVASYTIPIEVPPGIKGIQPAISIRYSSQGAGDGFSGHGWASVPVSLITRTGKSNFYDGASSPADFTGSNDVFVLNGQRLMLISGTNGADGAIYGTEQESFSKVQSVGGDGNSPAWFKVTTKDGTVMEYGTDGAKLLTNDGTQTLFWALRRVTDASGNYLLYDYSIDNTNRYYSLSSISYGGNSNTGTQPAYMVAFSYAAKTDWQSNPAYFSGSSVFAANILDQIIVKKSNNDPIRSYSFAYQYRQKKYFLTSVTEAGADGATLNPVTFTYGENLTANNVEVSPEYTDFRSGGSPQVYTGDFNGDGVQELIEYDLTYDNYDVGRYKRYFTPGSVQKVLSSTITVNGVTDTVKVDADITQIPFTHADFDGDDKDDVLFFRSYDSRSPAKSQQFKEVGIDYSRRLDAGAGITAKRVLYEAIPTSSYGAHQYYKHVGSHVTTGDFDGDGFLDYILILTCDNNAANKYKAFLSTPAKNVFNQEIINFGAGIDGGAGDFAAGKVAEAKQLLPVNFDGDGKTDLLVIRNEGSYVVSISGSAATGYSGSLLSSTTEVATDYKVYPGDFNGDGYADLLVRQSPNSTSGAWKILYSTGKVYNTTSFTFSENVILPGDGYSNANLLSVGDYDRDGKTDIWHALDISGTTLNHVYYSNGTSFETESFYGGTAINTEYASVAGDFNGDGKIDQFTLRYNSGYKGKFVYAKPFREENLLTGISNLGILTRFDYALLNGTDKYNPEDSIYRRSVAFEYDDPNEGAVPVLKPYAVVKSPAMYMLAEIKRPNGLKSSYTTEAFRYEDLVMHPSGRGLLGFKKTITRAPTGIYQVATSDVNLPWSLLLPVSGTAINTLDNNKTVSQALFTTSVQSLSTGPADKRFFIRNDQLLKKDFLTNAATETNNTYDNYGNITQSVAKAGKWDGVGFTAIETATATTTYGTYAGAAYPGFPLVASVQTTRTGQPTVSKTTATTYTAGGLPETIIDHAGTAIASTVTHTYNSFGLPIQTTISAPGVTTPVTDYIYDPSGRFLLEKKVTGDGIVKKETFTYDDRWALPLTATTTDGLTTTKAYNSFGELTHTDLPDGQSITVTKAWDVTGNNCYTVLTQMLDGSKPSKSYMDVLGREIKKEVRGFNNQWLTSTKTYNHLGQLMYETAPYYAGEPVSYIAYTYDNDGRKIREQNTKGAAIYSYSNADSTTFVVTTKNRAGQTSSQTMDAAGNVLQTVTNGASVSFTYDSWGNQLQSASNGQVFVSNTYDDYGRKATTTDANAGTVTYQYNALGQLTQQTDANSNIQTISYDVFGRTATTTGSQGTTTYTYYYDAGTGKSNNNITQVTGFNGDVHQYQYDALQRLSVESVTAAGSSLSKSYEYDARGQLVKTSYPAGFAIRDVYDDNGILTQTNYEQGATVKTLFTATAMNSRGIYTGYNTGNGKSGQVTYDFAKEAPVRYYTGGVQDLNLEYENNTMNLLSRRDGIRNLTENFSYDINDRLTGARVNGVQQFNITYDAGQQGKILQKTDVGNYQYDAQKMHALEYLAPISGGTDPNLVVGANTQAITYTSFLKAQTISENGYQLTYSYGYDQERLTSELKQNGVTIETRNHWGVMEGVTKNGVSSELYYIEAGNGLNNIIVKQNGAFSIYYTYTDQLGSITAVTDEAGTIIGEQNFDAWGRKRNPVDWTYSNIPAVPDWLYRGYTGHEHLANFSGTGNGLINMNGRMYDPGTGQMMAPDNYVQYPGMPGGYNRYQYANGNPLKFTDPTGDLTQEQWGQFVTAVNAMIAGNYRGFGESWWDNSTGTGHTVFSSDDQAFGYMSAMMSEYGYWGAQLNWASSPSEALRNYSGGSSKLTAGMWNGYMTAQWSSYAYDLSTINSSSAKYGAGFTTTGLTFTNADLGGAVTAFYSYGKAESLFFGAFGSIINPTPVGITLPTDSEMNAHLYEQWYSSRFRKQALGNDILGQLTFDYIAGGAVGRLGGALWKGLSAAKGVTNTVTRSESVLGHIFRNASGHVNPSTVTSQGRYINLFEKVANNSANLNPNILTNFQRTAGGFQGFSQTFRNGSQVWTQTLNGKIINAGVNIIPK
ncbi:FG-GAP-like repeat-containing protein [Niabella sp. 22666]|uniref:FG-GAP-like repeat-containing protein n=1 Tax=Niabella sp. 22666 TaxID=3453954 RepID=UPI003F83A705